MKKLLLSLAAASVMLVACNKESEAILPTSTSEAATATITGKVQAELNTTNTVLESIPDGTIIIATATHSGNTYRYETSASGGTYTFTVPCEVGGNTFTISFSDFVSDVTTGAGTTEDVVFTEGDLTVTTKPGLTEVRNVVY